MSKDGKYIPLITVKEKTNTEPAEFIELCTAPCDKGAKITVENEPSTPIPIIGSMTISEGLVDINLGSELNALSTFSQNGLVARVGVGNYIARTITSSSGINITNGDGIADNPLIELGTVPINKLAGYPNNDKEYLKGDGSWGSIFLNNLPTNGDLNLGSFSIATKGNVNVKTGSIITNNLECYNSNLIFIASGLAMNENSIRGLKSPTYKDEPATKDYVDSLMKKLESRFESIEKQMIKNNKQK